MAAKITLPIFEKFSIDETTTIASRWAKYKLRFGNLCKAIDLSRIVVIEIFSFFSSKTDFIFEFLVKTYVYAGNFSLIQ